MDNLKIVQWQDWETVRLIGRGSFGAVYEIQRNVFDDIEKAALKVIRIPQNSSEIEGMYSDGYDEESITTAFNSHLKNIVAEYSLMRKMNGNANIVNCDDVKYIQHEDGIGWDVLIKMELLTPLTKALPEKVPEETVERVAYDMCEALKICKKYDIVHRDIKPQNIFMSPNGDYKLGDFGIAKTIERTSGGTKIGTYKYMAPEVYNNQPYGSASDIYSLGIVLYWMLNERRMPFMPLPPEKPRAGMEEEARNRRLAGEPFPPPKNGSEKLKAIIMKACVYDVADRYMSAEEMQADLEAMRDEAPAAVSDVVKNTAASDVVKNTATVSGVVKDTAQTTAKIADQTAAIKQESGGKANILKTGINNTFNKTDKQQKKETAQNVKSEGKKKMKSTTLYAILAGVVIVIGVVLTLLFGNGGNGGLINEYKEKQEAELQAEQNKLVGWNKVSGVWHYYDTNGNPVSGFREIDGGKYYLDAEGGVQTGWYKLDNSWYYFGEGGKMLTGWQKIDGVWYYLQEDGRMANGWNQLDGKWYYMNADGSMTTGWQKIDGYWYYSDDTGAMQTGWVKIDNKWFYFESNGAMVTGWLKLNDVWYYFAENGEMVTGEQTIDGTAYVFGEDGRLME